MKENVAALFQPGSFINGQWLSGDDRFAVINKATGETLAEVASAGATEMQQAIDAAKQAFAGWSATPAVTRGQLLRKWFTLMTERSDELAELLTLEQGKPLAEAKGEIAYGAGYIEWFAEEARRIDGDVLPANSAAQRIYVTRQPVGVVGAITPWNFPNAMITRKAAAALAAGCTFVVKPASETPLSALALAALAKEAGIPDGVINVVVGTSSRELGGVLTQSPDVAKFSFTGSTQVGKVLTADCTSTMKRVSMELGGNAPFIVFDDADIDAAVAGAMVSKFRNAGQTCVCANRFIIHEDVQAEFVEKLLAKVADLKVGNGMDEGTTIGPLINEGAAKNVHQLVCAATAQGAVLNTGGEWDGASFYPPTVLTNVTPEMDIVSEEIFGPVVTVLTFKDDAEAIALANATEYGLASYFYSQNISRIHRVADALQFGMVGINEGAISNPAAPFGGVKESGYGREGSKYGLDDYSFIQYRCLGGI
ncbi:NAD-dependent succinate-semialdehyde dehydrogenase [Alteromonas lipolytica]|uniref:Succinate-semialdehyde dehydrogenase (NADP(+)) n=1 Tax=Alteromonas lipolytica TaxID=1856405 RepID=A0A1E8FHQ4_9ALTE|nr:NAD-dependent succinate-semialdehyde dehydrogenase [Alteromonas lipolytica]OFI35461.1 succinate-semialdehyde dehydrogenase (NADP(+)) [Alteromonas lipolytica]GGF76459.1 NAD-dependent succinate-semialdehyde dehydrogenase [Alteromonas lipolytica]